MPIHVTYTQDGGLLVTGEGAVSGSDLVEANKKIYASEEKIKQIVYQLVDFSDISELHVILGDVEKIAVQDRAAARVNPDMFIAIVGKRDLVYGLSRMWEAMTEEAPFETKVFRELSDAQEWIQSKLLNNNRKHMQL
ncbi:hypothetical protein JXA32_00750 [Candidatus Sumerlaeota bacterium]|nr:hypothetical protein [Candidatus Sumerlaeota bacterium]